MTPEEGIPTKSKDYLLAVDVFYDQFNDVNFYIEDSEQEELYFEILSKIFPGTKLRKIFPLGGKKNVIDEAQLASRRKKRKKCVFIVDKDFDDLLGKIVGIKNLFYLSHYCIENYFLEEEAIVNFVVSQRPRLKRSTVKTTLQSSKVLRDAVKQLHPLFILFLVVQKKQLRNMENVGMPVERFFKDQVDSTIDDAKIELYKRAVLAKIAAGGNLIDLEKEVRRAERIMLPGLRRLPLGQHISGKYLAKIIYCKLGSTFGVRGISFDAYCYQLAHHCSFHSLSYLKKRVMNYLTA